jgi:hypothetical protein
LGLVGQLLDHISAPRQIEDRRPTEVSYEIRPNGRVVSNLSVRQIVELKMKRQQRDEYLN